MRRKAACRCRWLAFILSWSLSCSAASAQLNSYNFSPLPFALPTLSPGQQTDRRPLSLPGKASSLQDILPRINYPSTFLQPLNLQGIKIPGLTPKSVQKLGQNFFLVVDNPKFATMASIYRDNRLHGKSNFVTADSIIHPYFAFTNRVLADTISQHIAPDLEGLLKAMLETSLADCKQAEDNDVRDDIEHNIAFLAVAVKLIDPQFFPPVPLHIVPLIQADLKAIYSRQATQSAIFKRACDFSSFEPPGWYGSTARLQNFYRCRQWVSQMSYPFADVDGSQGGNYFRRGALLYRSLDLARVKGTPAYQTWERLFAAWPLMGAQLKDWQENTICPAEYKAQVKTSSSDLKVTLNSLSQPLFRAKLLLSVRKQKPLKLSATSIADLDDTGSSSGAEPVAFRLLPPAGDPEWPWLKASINLPESSRCTASTWPFPLLVLHAWGAPQANNTLLDNYVKLDAPALLSMLPQLDQLVTVKLPGGNLKPIDDRRWQILAGYFQPYPQTAQQVMRTEVWMTRMLESAFAGWVDSHLALAADSPGAAEGKAAGKQEDKQDSKQAEQDLQAGSLERKKRASFFHCVQATPAIFQKIADDAQHLQSSLDRLGYLPEKFKSRFADFSRLAGRLKKMAETELTGQALPLADIKLLQNIDLVLAQVESPLEGTLALQPPAAASVSTIVGAKQKGVNFGLGCPGQLFIILQDGVKWTLGRGAVYTYYELPGPPVSAAHWQRKLDCDLLRPVWWAEPFDVVQDTTDK